MRAGRQCGLNVDGTIANVVDGWLETTTLTYQRRLEGVWGQRWEANMHKKRGLEGRAVGRQQTVEIVHSPGARKFALGSTWP